MEIDMPKDPVIKCSFQYQNWVIFNWVDSQRDPMEIDKQPQLLQSLWSVTKNCQQGPIAEMPSPTILIEYPPAADGTNTETHSWTLCRGWKTLERPTINGMDVSFKSRPSGLREPWERGGRKSIWVSGVGGHDMMKTHCLNQHDQSSYKLTEWDSLRGDFKGLPRSSTYILQLPAECFFLSNFWMREQVSLYFLLFLLISFYFACFCPTLMC